jgi:phosphoribosylformylglycinamidine cyclo-ligase
VHSNGYSLVRRLAEDKQWQLDRPAPFDPERLLIDMLIQPTRIYVKGLLPTVRTGKIDALAHITGGGLLENVPRVLPEGAHAVIDADAWEQPGLMAFLQAEGSIEPGEMARTFNCGVGMVLAVPAELAREVAAELETAGEAVMRIGEVIEGPRGCTVRGVAGTWNTREAWSATHEV